MPVDSLARVPKVAWLTRLDAPSTRIHCAGSTLQFRLIAALLWLLAAVVGSLGAYNISEYVAFRCGERVQATVVEDEAGIALGRATLGGPTASASP